MKKLFLLSLMVATGSLPALAMPVLFSLQSLTGHISNRSILVQPDRLQNPLNYGTNLMTLGDFTLQPIGGQVITNLTPWGYTIRVDGWPRSAHIRVYDTTNIVNVVSLINTNDFAPLNIYFPNQTNIDNANGTNVNLTGGSVTNLSSIAGTNGYFNQIFFRDNFGNIYLRLNSNGDFLDVFGNVIVGAGGALHYQVVGGSTSLLTDGSANLYYPSGKVMADIGGGLHYGHAALPDYIFQIISPPAGDGSDPAGEIFLYYPPQFSGSGPSFTQTPMVDATGLRYPVPNAGGNLADQYGNIDAAFTGQAFLSGDGTVYWPELINHKHMTTTGDILSMSGKQIATTNGFIVFQTNAISFWPIAPLHRGDQMLVNSNGTMYWLKSGANGNTWISTNLAN